jgi:hypothetical protein
MRLKRTLYRHVYNADGTRRAEPCDGFMEVHSDSRIGVHAACNKCGESYRFVYIGVAPDGEKWEMFK